MTTATTYEPVFLATFKLLDKTDRRHVYIVFEAFDVDPEEPSPLHAVLTLAQNGLKDHLATNPKMDSGPPLAVEQFVWSDVTFGHIPQSAAGDAERTTAEFVPVAWLNVDVGTVRYVGRAAELAKSQDADE